jgi:tape measure domain-containing protein
MDIKRTLLVAIDPSGAVSGARVAEGAFRSVGNAARGAEVSTKTFSSSLLSLRNILAAVGVGAFVRELYQTDVAMFRLSNQLKYASANLEDFGKNFDFIRGISVKLGLDLRTTGDAFGQFAAAAKGKLTSAQIRETFTAISEAAVAMGLSTEQTNGAVVALWQMLSKGTVSAQELRMQLGNALPGAFQMAAEAMGKTEKEMNKAMDAGAIMADELVPKLAKKLHEAFGPASVEGAKTLQAEVNRLKTAWTELQMVVMSDGGESIFARVIRSAKSAIEDVKQWLASLFEANREGRLSEAIAASLRIGIGKAANYFGGFVKTAAEMLAEAGKVMFTADYFTALLGSFQAVASAFGLALLEALQKPLAYVQAVLEKVASLDQSDSIARAQQWVLRNDPRFSGLSVSQINVAPGFLGALMRNPAEQDRYDSFYSAVGARRSAVEGPDLTIEQRYRNILDSGGVRYGTGALTVEQLQTENQRNLESFVGDFAKQTGMALQAATQKLAAFQPVNAVDTSADESLLKGFLGRSSNQWVRSGGVDASEVTKIADKTIWSELKRGIDEATASLSNLFDQAYKAGGDAVGAMTRGFTGFFDNIIDGSMDAAEAFRKMTASILADIAKIISQRMIAEPLAAALMGGLGRILGGALFGGGASGGAALGSSGLTGGYDGTLLSSTNIAPAGFGVHHRGGFVGLTLPQQMLVDPRVFNFAPRLHSGLKPDEFPAILQRGEEVVPKNRTGRGAVTVSMPITVHVDGSKGGTPEQNQKFGAEVARQIDALVDSRIVQALMPGGPIYNAVNT